MVAEHHCTNGRKIRYPTLAEAQRALEEARRTWRVPPIRWYRCPYCDGYHLTAKPDSGRGREGRDAEFEEARQRKADWQRRHNPFAALDDLRGEADAA